MRFNVDNQKLFTVSQNYQKNIDAMRKKHGEVRGESSIYVFPVNSDRVSGIYIFPDMEYKKRVLNAIYQWTSEVYNYNNKALESFLAGVNKFIDIRAIGTPRRDNPVGINLALMEHEDLLGNLLAFIELVCLGNIRVLKQKSNRPYIISENLKRNFEYYMNDMGKI